MSDFKAKMRHIQFRLVIPLGELTALPSSLAGFQGPTSKGGERGGEWEGEEKERGKREERGEEKG